MIPDDVVDRVRNETDPVSLIGEYVKLKRMGTSHRGPCPFHHGKNPNFAVSDNGYYCFKCGEKGDVFTFVQKHLGMSFVESVKFVGEKSGIEVREVTRRPEEKDVREPLWEANAIAADFFKTQLWESPEGKVARDYLSSRGIGQMAAERFGIGYAPRDGAEMRESLRALGFDDDRQLAAGLVVSKQDRPELRARFRGRLMIPIYDVQNHVVGFGGRILGVGEPKYLNSSESEIFAKRTLLYGLNWAKQAARKADRLIIVEGYFDAIRLMLAGIEEVVAPMGTALTEQQASTIRKYTKNVLLLYDSDQAGLKATFRSGDALLSVGVSARVVSLPDGEDPDTFVAKEGVDALENAFRQSVDVFDRKIQILERGGWFADLHRKRSAVDRLLPTIRATSDRLLRDMYIARVSEVADIGRETLLSELQQSDFRAAEEQPWHPPSEESERLTMVDRRATPVGRRTGDQTPPSVIRERETIRAMLDDPRLTRRLRDELDSSWFRVVEYRRIFTELVNADPDAPFSAVFDSLDEGSATVLQSLLEEIRRFVGQRYSTGDTVDGMLKKMQADLLSREAEQLQIDLESTSSEEEKYDLLRRRDLNNKQRLALGRAPWKMFRPKH